jgi:hypothetical protein
MNSDLPEGLKFCISIIKEAKNYKKTHEDEDENENKEWSVFSEVCSSEDNSERDHMAMLLKEVNDGRLKRKSTLVSDFGFSKKAKLELEKKHDIIRSKDSFELRQEQQNASHRNWLKYDANKRKI